MKKKTREIRKYIQIYLRYTNIFHINTKYQAAAGPAKAKGRAGLAYIWIYVDMYFCFAITYSKTKIVMTLVRAVKFLYNCWFAACILGRSWFIQRRQRPANCRSCNQISTWSEHIALLGLQSSYLIVYILAILGNTFGYLLVFLWCMFGICLVVTRSNAGRGRDIW